MQKQQPLDIVQLAEITFVPRNGVFLPEVTKSWKNCEFFFVHKSNFWAEEYWHTIPFHDWPADGSDYAFVFRISKQPSRNPADQYKSIFMNTVYRINSVGKFKIEFSFYEPIRHEYSVEFSNERKLPFLMNVIHQQIPIFRWDAITDFEKNRYWLLNSNLFKPANVPQQKSEEQKAEEEFDEWRIPLQPQRPSTKAENMDLQIAQAGPSTSTTTTMPSTMIQPTSIAEEKEKNDIIERLDDDDDPDFFYDLDELDGVIFE
uniref:Uncharacterized protein LOC113794415 n=1 Tax=Dermatophagoides pteronyssinus TaxID=6956 RepID=A0A6P6Y4C9_DERPT|nr:uncharacterized protein LOC113794415 [Dermatophagoides pteronyssinus]